MCRLTKYALRLLIDTRNSQKQNLIICNGIKDPKTTENTENNSWKQENSFLICSFVD